MRKCPNCNKRTIKIFNKSFLTNHKPIICENCNTKVGFSKMWTLIMTLIYVLWLIYYFIVNFIIDVNFLRFIIGLIISGIIMIFIQLFIIPYEKR